MTGKERGDQNKLQAWVHPGIGRGAKGLRGLGGGKAGARKGAESGEKE